MTLSPEDQLERACDIADAKLGVAERIGGHLASAYAMAAALVLIRLDWPSWASWAAGIAFGIGAYVVATHGHKKERERAWNAVKRGLPP